jgi:dipeptide/tripeptide permease
MGGFFLTNAAGNYFAGFLAGLAVRIPAQGTFYLIFLAMSLVADAVGFACVPLLKRLTDS